jgi:spermidine synthase
MNLALAKEMKEADGVRFAIERFELTPEMVTQQKLASLKEFCLHENYDLRPGVYMRLVDKQEDEVVMSDTPMERRTNSQVVGLARGHVLIAGLGLGMILRPMIESPEVKTITVVEKFAEVIELNRRAGFDINHHKLRMVNADIFNYHFPEVMKFDTIYFDIWNRIGKENLDGMNALHERFRKHLRPGGWMESWRREDCQEEVAPWIKDFYRALIKKSPLMATVLISESLKDY